MAVFILRNAWCRINGVDLSTYVSEVAVEMSVDAVDVTAMGAGGRQRIPGIREDQFSITMFSDFASGKVDDTLWPLFSGGSLFNVEVAAASSTISATNPRYSGTCMLEEYQPIAGAVGDAASTPVTLLVQGTIARGTV